MVALRQKQIGIIYLDRNLFTYYRHEGNPVTYTFSDDTIHEMEVTNEELFKKNIEEFITTSKLAPATVLIILAKELLYEKEFVTLDQPPKPEVHTQAAGEQSAHPPEDPSHKPVSEVMTPEERIRQIQFFTETVPFEEIGSKTYKIEKGLKVVATNKELYSLVIEVFTKMGFTIPAVVPLSMIPKEFHVDGMSQEIARSLFEKIEAIKQFDMLDETQSQIANGATPGHLQITTKVTSKREYALLGVFGVLLIVLGIVAYTQLFAASAPPQKIASISEKVTPTTPVTPTNPAASTSATPSAPVNRTAIRIEVNGGTDLQVNLFRQQLLNVGFTNVITKSAGTPATGKTLVVFSPTLPPNAREELMTEIRKTLLNVTAQENALVDRDVVITL